MLPTKDYLKWDGTIFRDDRGDVARAKERNNERKGRRGAKTAVEDWPRPDPNSTDPDDQQVIRLLDALKARGK